MAYVWIFGAAPDDKHTQDIRQAILELNEQSDRAAAIVASSILDIVLTSALKRFLYHKPKVVDKFFAITGPVGDFGAKIDLALLVEFVDEAFYRDLVTIKDIRNSFAHKLHISSFQSESIKTLSSNLKIVETHSYDSKNRPPKDPPAWSIGISNRKETLADPRARFLLAVSFATFRLIWNYRLSDLRGGHAHGDYVSSFFRAFIGTTN